MTQQAHYWPAKPVVIVRPPRLPDGTVDIRRLCRQWDDLVNSTLDAEDET